MNGRMNRERRRRGPSAPAGGAALPGIVDGVFPRVGGSGSGKHMRAGVYPVELRRADEGADAAVASLTAVVPGAAACRLRCG